MKLCDLSIDCYFSKTGEDLLVINTASKIEAVVHMMDAHSKRELKAKSIGLELFLSNAKEVQLDGLSLNLEEVVRRYLLMMGVQVLCALHSSFHFYYMIDRLSRYHNLHSEGSNIFHIYNLQRKSHWFHHRICTYPNHQVHTDCHTHRNGFHSGKKYNFPYTVYIVSHRYHR